ncbi:MAG: hypothetical protein IJ991_05815, partial [Thermoguttaceae bacterium]|nr:hypothetical protein [Thermoguttaceae bacterium]
SSPCIPSADVPLTRIDETLITQCNTGGFGRGSTAGFHHGLMARWRSCFHRHPPTPEICAAWQTSPEAAVRAWELSEKHADIMHGARYTKIAPGVAYDAEGRLYWTLRIW